MTRPSWAEPAHDRGRTDHDSDDGDAECAKPLLQQPGSDRCGMRHARTHARTLSHAPARTRSSARTLVHTRVRVCTSMPTRSHAGPLISTRPDTQVCTSMPTRSHMGLLISTRPEARTNWCTPRPPRVQAQAQARSHWYLATGAPRATGAPSQSPNTGSQGAPVPVGDCRANWPQGLQDLWRRWRRGLGTGRVRRRSAIGPASFCVQAYVLHDDPLLNRCCSLVLSSLALCRTLALPL